MVDSDAIGEKVQLAFRLMERSQRSRGIFPGKLVSALLEDYGEKALALLGAGKSDEALALLTTFLEPFLERWMDFVEQDECSFHYFSQELARGLLEANLTPVQRESWLKQIPIWQAELDNFGGGELDSVQEILRNSGANLATLVGEDRQTTFLRLDHLEQCGKLEEALALAEATQSYRQQASLLERLDRLEELEAVVRAYCKSFYGEARQELVERVAQKDKARALRLGTLFLRTLWDDGEEDEDDGEEEPESISAAPSRLSRVQSFEDHHSQPGLARCVMALAQELEDHPVQMEAHRALVLAEPTRAHWEALVALAGPQDALLQQLSRASSVPSGTVEILLAHERWADAWHAAQRCYEKDVLEKTADAVAAQLPTEVSEYSRNLIEDAIGDQVSARRGQRGDPYPIVAAWLARLRVAELALGQGVRWNTLLRELRQKHARKYTLMPYLNALELAPETEAETEAEAAPSEPAIPAERRRLVFKVDSGG